MADKKISQLTNLTGANLAENDEFVLVDTSADETKAITFGELKTAFDTGTGFVRVTGDTMTGDLSFNGGDTIYGDNDKAIFGAGSDLQIYHDGGNSVITNSTGSLIIRDSVGGNILIQGLQNQPSVDAIANGAVNLYFSGNQKLATTSTGIDVTGTVIADSANITGTVTADGLISDTSNGLKLNTATVVEASWTHVAATGASTINIGRNSTWGGKLTIQTDTKNRANFASNGDISFYEDTGTTPKFFWDASAESLGIGTTSPVSFSGQTSLTVRGTSVGRVDVQGAAGAGGGALLATSTSMSLSSNYNIPLTLSAGTLSYTAFNTSGTERMRIDSSGNVGIGTSSPSYPLHVQGTTSAGDVAALVTNHSNDGSATLRLSPSTVSTRGAFIRGLATSASGQPTDLLFATGAAYSDAAERMRIDSSGNVGIGTSSPTDKLNISSGSNQIGLDTGNQATYGTLDIGHFTNGAFIGTQAGSNAVSNLLRFGTSGTERMRIDSSGNLLVGQSSTITPGLSNTTTGLSLTNNGYIFASKDSDNVAWFNRNSSDGSIVSFRKDGSTVGSIGTYNGDGYIGNGDVGFIFADGDDSILPANTSTPAYRDAAVKLGNSSYRWKDLYLSGGVYLGGTGAANKLDDYETGTWTPTMGGTTTNPTVSYSSRSGKYTKIGRLVHLYFYINISSYSGGSGLSTITGMPFGGANEDAVYFYYGGGSSKSLDKGALQSSGRIVFGQDAVGGIDFIQCSEMNAGGGLIVGNVTYTTS